MAIEATEARELQPADVGEYYDQWTEKYLADFGSSIQAHRPSREDDLLDYLMRRAGIRDGQRLLDAGCGICGPARHFAARRDVTIEAITISPLQAKMARERNAAARLDQRIRVTHGDFHQLASLYGREQFDLVYFLESLSHSARPADVLRSVYEVLRPGGIVYIKDFFVLEKDDPAEQRRVLEVIERIDRTFAVKTVWPAQMEELLRAAGFFRLFTSKPEFVVDNSVWQSFAGKHQFDLWPDGVSFEAWQWLELRYQKP